MSVQIQLVIVPVSYVDRAKDFYTGIGFHADHDASPFENMRYVQLTPPGSACSIAIGHNITEAEPGSLNYILAVVEDVAEARRALVAAGVDATEVADEGWGLFTHFADPDGNKWAYQQLT